MKYRSANSYYKEVFGHKVYRVSVSLATTCPNRDGTKGVGGCTFCSSRGSGEFGADATYDIKTQIDQAIEKLSSKIPADCKFICYFQSFSGTYVAPKLLELALDEATTHPRIVGISIGTRPDCLGDEIMDILKKTSSRVPLYIELGLQSSNRESYLNFNRCYENDTYVDAITRLHLIGANVITHLIVGLPGEGREDVINSVKFAIDARTDGLKFTSLYVVRGTKMEELYNEGKLQILSMEEYFDIIEEVLNIVPDDVVIYRLTGDGAKSTTIAPAWSFNKRQVINYINRRFK